MDKCSCLNHEALIGVLKTVYLFLESQNFRETCETFLSESKHMGYEQLKQAIACILVLKPTADMVRVAHVDPSKTDVEIEADIVREYDDTSLPYTYYGEPLCLRCLATDTLSSAEIAAGICPCKDRCRARKNIVKTIDNSKNDIQTHNVLTRVVQEEVKLAAPMHETMLESKDLSREKEDHPDTVTQKYHVTISRDNLHNTPRYYGTDDESDNKTHASAVDVKIVSGSSAIGSKVNVSLKDDKDDKNDKDLILPASKHSILKTNVHVSGGHAEEVEVILHTEDYKDGQLEQHENNVKPGEPTLKSIEFVENEPFLSKTSLQSSHIRALPPTSLVRFDLGSEKPTVVTQISVEALPSETSENPSSTITTHSVVVSPKQSSGSSRTSRSPSVKSVVQEHTEELTTTLAPDKTVPLSEESGNILKVGKCLKKDTAACSLVTTRSAHATAGVDAVERSASTHSLNARYQLDYSKVKRELRWGCPSVRGVLLQALRWRLTRSTPELRNEIMADYARHDLLNLHGAPKSYTTLVEEFLCTNHGKLGPQHQEGMARMVNAMASLTLGRDYLCQDQSLVSKLIIPLLMNTHPSKVELSGISSDYLWVALQKLSLRNNMRLVMIHSGLAEYLVTFLSKNHNLVSDYCLEYCLALFMNLCLHAETHNRLKKKSRDIVKFISDFLSANHDACLSYINGAMYSLFMDPDIRREAKHGHLDTKISEKSKFVDEETKQQLEVILEVLNTNKPGPECKTCDCRDQDDEVDHLEDEIEYADLVHGTPGGENLLSLYRAESDLTDSLTVPLTCICRPVTPCKKISAMEKCPLSPECERTHLKSESFEKKVKGSCFGLCKKSKGHETIWDEERVLATEMCPVKDHICCDDERVPVKESIPPSFSTTVVQGENTISIIVEQKSIPGILASSRSLAAHRPHSVTLPQDDNPSIITMTSTKHDAIRTPSVVSVDSRVSGNYHQEPPRLPAHIEVERVPSQISQPLISLTDECQSPCQISAKSSGTCEPPCRIDPVRSAICPSGDVTCTQVADLTCAEIGTDCAINQQALLTCQDCCSYEMKQSEHHITSTHSLPTGILSTSSKHDNIMTPSVVFKESIEIPGEGAGNDVSVVVQAVPNSLHDESTNTIIITVGQSQTSHPSIHETATAATAETYYAEPTTIEPSPEPVLSQKSIDREHSFFGHCGSSLKKLTSSGCCHSLKNVKCPSLKRIKSSTHKPMKIHHPKPEPTIEPSPEPKTVRSQKPTVDSTSRLIDREHSFLKDNIVECDPRCTSGAVLTKTEPQKPVHDKEEVPLKKHTSSGCCHSLKNVKCPSIKHMKSGTPKPTKTHHNKPVKSTSSKAAITPTRKTSTKSSFRPLDHVSSFLRDNIQCDITCSGYIGTIDEVPQGEVTSKKGITSGGCVKRRSTEQSERSLFSRCKFFEKYRTENVPSSFTRTTISQPSKNTLQYNPCEQCTDQSYTCKSYIFSQQSNSYQSFRPYCYNVTKNICRNASCSCPNDSARANVVCGTCQASQACGHQSCSTKSKYTCDCYNNMQKFSQSADLNRICRKSSEEAEEEPKEINEVSTPEAEYKTLLQALADSDNLCELGINETFRSIDCECYTLVFQSRPKLQRTP